MKKIIALILILNSVGLFSQDYGIATLPSFQEDGEAAAPSPEFVPVVPVIIQGDSSEHEGDGAWKLDKTFNLMMESRVNVVVPLEIISDIDIKATVIDNQELEIPFEIEMNREPEKKDHYLLQYSQREIDIDGDGKIDTKIYSPKYINKKILDENRLVIQGENISNEGTHRKKIYITVEIKDGEIR